MRCDVFTIADFSLFSTDQACFLTWAVTLFL